MYSRCHHGANSTGKLVFAIFIACLCTCFPGDVSTWSPPASSVWFIPVHAPAHDGGAQPAAAHASVRPRQENIGRRRYETRVLPRPEQTRLQQGPAIPWAVNLSLWGRSVCAEEFRDNKVFEFVLWTENEKLLVECGQYFTPVYITSLISLSTVHVELTFGFVLMSVAEQNMFVKWKVEHYFIAPAFLFRRNVLRNSIVKYFCENNENKTTGCSTFLFHLYSLIARSCLLIWMISVLIQTIHPVPCNSKSRKFRRASFEGFNARTKKRSRVPKCLESHPKIWQGTKKRSRVPNVSKTAGQRAGERERFLFRIPQYGLV